MIATREDHKCRSCGYRVNVAVMADGSKVCGMCSEPVPPAPRKAA